VDSGLAYSGVETKTITGMGHLEGETVQVFHDGNEFETVVVTSGNVVIDVNVTAATIGLSYTSTLVTFPIEFQSDKGSTVGYKKKIYEIVGCFYRTMYGQYGVVGQFIDPTMYDIPFSSWPDTTNGSDAHYTGQIRLEVDGGWDDELQIKFIQAEPYPFNITAIQMKVGLGDN